MSLTGGLSAGLVAGLSGRAMAGVSAAWNPGDLTGLVATLLPAESLARGLLWQNTAKTVAATADGDPVRVAVCPYTGVEFTASSDARRPLLWDDGGGLWSLYFDGVDDVLIATGLSVGQCTVGVAAQHGGGGGAAQGGYWELLTQSFFLPNYAGVVAIARRQSPQRDFNASPLAANTYQRVIVDVTNAAGVVYLNGTELGRNSDATTTPTATTAYVGGWTSGVGTDCNVAGFVVAAVASAPDRDLLDDFLASTI